LVAWILLLRRAIEREKRKESDGDRVRDERETERTQQTHAVFQQQKKGKEIRSFLNMRPCGSILGIALLLQRDFPVSQCVVFA
jgi:hypothetical protein